MGLDNQVRYVLPVIHHVDFATTLEQAILAFECEADGVFLISHGGHDQELLAPGAEIKRRYPDKRVGVNFLGMSALEALQTALSCDWVDMVWVDDAGVTSKGLTQEAFSIRDLLMSSLRPIEFFGSVAFKYQPNEADPAQAAVRAHQMHMIPTTSGPATGIAPPLSKVWNMRYALGDDLPLAVASGLSPSNVYDYLGALSHYLVSTGVSDGDFHRFNRDKLRTFVVYVQAANLEHQPGLKVY